MSDLAELLESVARDAGDHDQPRPLHEAQIMTLREIYARYQTCTFEQGELITPIAGCGALKNVGEPHIILEIDCNPEPHFDAQPGSHLFGRRPDLRVACLNGTEYCAFWVESWQFQRYEAEGS